MQGEAVKVNLDEVSEVGKLGQGSAHRPLWRVRLHREECVCGGGGRGGG